MNKFENYYAVVKEDSQNVVDDLFDDLVTEMEESGFGFSIMNFMERYGRSLDEYNNYMPLNLRESVEILEQSNRLIDDSSLYVNSGDCRDQVKSMAYWTYKNDLRAEFYILLKEQLQHALPSYEENVEKIQKQIDETEELIESKEQELAELEKQLDEAQQVNIETIDNLIEKSNIELENLQKTLNDLSNELEKPSNLYDNTEKVISELS